MQSAYSSCLNAAIAHSECDLPLFQATHSEYDINKVNIGEIDAHVNVLTESRDHGSSAAVQAANLSNNMKHNGKGSKRPAGVIPRTSTRTMSGNTPEMQMSLVSMCFSRLTYMYMKGRRCSI